MIKRYKFQCWNCPKVYFQSLDITGQHQIIVSCPYCRAEAVVDLRPYLKKVGTVLRKDADDSAVEAELPETLRTYKLHKPRMPGDPTIDAPPPEGKKKKKGKSHP